MGGEEANPRHTCLKLQVKDEGNPNYSIFVKGTWFAFHFDLAITDGLHSWVCNASEEDVRERASQWDESVSEYIQFAENYLGLQQPNSVYSFADAGNGHRRLSWTFDKQGVKLEWRWRCKPSPNDQITTATILDFLMDQSNKLSEQVVIKDKLFENTKQEADRCFALNKRLCAEKHEFESQVYAKFVSVLNSKKAKLRELRDRLSKLEAKGKLPQEEDASTDETEDTEPYQSDSNEEDGANSD